jgi:uncharacterized protein with NAD-binding domain and iron-sulfur cluster
MGSMTTVAVLGGGIGGLTAAHELAERGYDVTVYERRAQLGGKARSYPQPDTPGRGPALPGEHGFRFFPGFYRHVPDTMSRIPDGAGRHVSDHLVPAMMATFSRIGQRDARFPTQFPRTAVGLVRYLYSMLSLNLGVKRDDMEVFFRRLFYLATSSDERRFGQIEECDWTFWIDAKDRPAAYQLYCADGLTRLLVAARADLISARTAGSILLQLFSDLGPGQPGADRVLDGPTSEVWIEPWRVYLASLPRKVTFAPGSEVTAVRIEGNRVVDASVAQAEGGTAVSADYFVLALPHECVAALADGNRDLAHAIGDLTPLRNNWMNGMQLYLRRALPPSGGHVAYMQSSWSLTSISQAQFWPHEPDRRGDGSIKDILSVDISEWDRAGTNGKTAKQCAPDEIKAEVVKQIREHLDDQTLLQPQDIAFCRLDTSLQYKNGSWHNDDPLLINTKGSWKHRPEAVVADVGNLFLAGDYVRTHTDLATMESANEAGRRAANGVMAASDDHRRADVWALHELPIPRLAALKQHDRDLYAAHPSQYPWQKQLEGDPIDTAIDDIMREALP